MYADDCLIFYKQKKNSKKRKDYPRKLLKYQDN